jgi:hypothetical protein
MSEHDLTSRLRFCLSRVRVLPRRMLLETPEVRATVPMLRGVWGAALHDLDAAAYRAVFHPDEDEQERLPGFVLRPAPPDPQFAPAVEWILIGDEAVRFAEILVLAWGMAMERGLGKQRQPFRIRKIVGLMPQGIICDQPGAWPLSKAAWPVPGEPAATPCRLQFVTPLSLWREKELILEPTLADIVIRAGRRIEAFLPGDRRERWRRVRGEAIELAKSIPTQRWHGERLDLQRYSSSQARQGKPHQFEVPGVAGWLDLPAGPGEVWPLLAALQWIHIGKSTVVGLGQLVIRPLRP